MAKVQQIFYKVIDGGHYPSQPGFRKASSGYMCTALSYARGNGTITQEEYSLGMDAIREYIGDEDMTLATMLRRNSLSFSNSDCLRIYCNWDERPALDLSL